MLIFIVVLALLAITQGAIGSTTVRNSVYGHGSTEEGKGPQDQKGSVASLSSTCSQIGIDIIKRGGNAADAIIAAQFCLGVIGMSTSGWLFGMYTEGV
jgi:gamma-glutamyltranspeptidase/glutathione hydrolase